MDITNEEKEELDLKIEELKEFTEGEEFKKKSAGLQATLKRRLEVTQELSGVLQAQVAATTDKDEEESGEEGGE
jgi:hypothetical protein